MGNKVSNIWGKMKDTASNVWGGFKDGLGSVVNVGNNIRDGFNNVYDKIKSVPVVGELLDTAVNMPIPYFGNRSASEMAGYANKGLDYANKVNNLTQSKDWGSAAKNAAGLLTPAMIGGLLPRKKAVF